ncbi:MAG: hypothetical protein KF730_09970 [Sphingomonas sp.]|uniref:hypothetical protein n=1 Tax=Sphingomonas sp. TaxID=28214 RepID=UPI0025EEC57B|nr:hypothetical protein [Sphingomonas sp.]MBX3564888.1 hypothetical protein [Sphingomonas sp.]
MTIEPLGAVSPIHMIGESHSLVFNNLLFRAEERTFLCRTRFLATLKAADYLAGGNLDTGYAEALIAEGILDAELRPAFLHAEPSAAFLAGAPMLAPPMVLFAGDLDLHGLFRQLGNAYDFVLPDDPHFGIDAAKQSMAHADIHAHIAACLAPFLDAVRMLQGVGFSRMMIHCLPPRTPDAQAASNWTGGAIIDAPIRAKLTLLANRLLADFCAETAIPFIDTWPELTEAGLLRPEFELDGCHVNRASALVSLDKIAATLRDRTANIANPIRYGHAARQAERHAPSEAHPEYPLRWAQTGLVHDQLGADALARLSAGLTFDRTGNPQARPDWVGRPRAGQPGITLAEPAGTWLTHAARIFSQGQAAALLHAGSRRDLTVASARPIRYAANATATPLPAPPGTRRAIVMLSATDRLTFTTSEGTPVAPPPTGHGTLIVYDPERLHVEVNAGTEDIDLIELAITPRLSGQPFRVTWAGHCDWPADPFLYSVADMKAAPEFPEAIFRERSRR